MSITEDQLEKAFCDMALLFRILDRSGLSEGIANHCTYLLPDNTMLVNKWGILWSKIKKSDILRFDSNGKVLNGKGNITGTSAFHIHEPIHRLCKANVVLHTHMPYATTIACLEGGELEPVSQNALRFYGKIAYDNTYKGFVDNTEEGKRLAKIIGKNTVLMMGSHGVVVVGKSIATAFYDMYYLERAAMVQILGATTGKPFKKIEKHMMETTAAEFDKIDHFKEKHFEALRELLDETEPDYKN